MTPLGGGVSSANCQVGEDATNGIVEFFYNWRMAEGRTTGYCSPSRKWVILPDLSDGFPIDGIVE
jgi:hypothetical protein